MQDKMDLYPSPNTSQVVSHMKVELQSKPRSSVPLFQLFYLCGIINKTLKKNYVFYCNFLFNLTLIFKPLEIY